MDSDESLLRTLGMADAMPPLPDDVWERALSIALDPTTPAVDADLVPEMDDIPVVPDDDGEIVLDDDTDVDDGGPGHHDLAVDHHDFAVDHDGLDGDHHDLAVDHHDLDGDAGHHDLAMDHTTFDDTPDLGGDLY
ncbi:hypothetical protein [Prescottella agglutinans]|jgi:hypothetical protein|uniref:Uncharacterized protein n=1 Tax=Prescottella agglutinans TaxID=1644129 RepID=A0ABT6MMB0_9NOCA|nr:hypothetical protein [Prescottella agglutinans]MDH6284664.1 hypothetical protein [Prescottella agglutinans]